jgi:hypothetical protein
VIRSPRLVGALIVLASAVPAGLAAQDILVAVTDEVTGRPIGAARVELAGVEGGALGLADDRGTVTLYEIETGTILLRASALGYAPQELSVEVPEEGFTSIVFGLRPAPVELEGLSVEVATRVPYLRRSGFYERSASNRGYYYDAERLDGMPATTVIGKLRSLRRLRRMRDGTISIGTCRDPNIWVDRLFVESQDLDRAMRPEDIVGVEIYDQGNLIPIRFRTGSGACGAIVIWSVKR